MSLAFHSKSHCQRGITLIELVLTIVIVGIAVSGVVGAFSLMVGRSADPLVQSRATALGQYYLDEILARNFDRETGVGGAPVYDGDCRSFDPSTDANSPERNQFTGVEQFDGLDDDPPRYFDDEDDKKLGESYSEYAVQVEIVCGGTEVDLKSGTVKRIEVTVTDPEGRKMEFSAYKGNY